jgi:anti-sigma B factor antagonist
MNKHTGMDLSSQRLGERVAVLRIAGEVDLYNTPQLKQEILGLIESGVRHLVVDLSETQLLDSTGLGALIGGLKRLRERDGDLCLLNPRPRIRRDLEKTRLVNVFEICDSVDRAVQKWNEQGVTEQ